MKYSELNDTQKKAYRNIKQAMYDYIGTWENTLEDEEEGSEEYNEAYEALHNRKTMIDNIYYYGTNWLYTESGFKINNEKLIKEIRFCGKDWLVKVINNLLIKEGY